MGFFTNDSKTIKIACEGASVAGIDELNELQGNLKTNTDEGYEWQKKSILDLGFSFPMSIWIDKDGKKWEIDGHRRLRTLRRMRDEEGYNIPLIPINFVYAENKTEAKKKILVNVSQPEEVTEEGFDDFVNEEGSEIENADDYFTVAYDDNDIEEDESEIEKEEEQPKTSKLPPCEPCKNFHARNHAA